MSEPTIVWDRYPRSRGQICVLRYALGECEVLEVLAISPQSSYRECPGCFSIL